VRDTSPDALRVQAEVHRRLGGAHNILVACRMSDSVREIARARIRAQHPELDETGVQDELTFELYGFRRKR
jgi:hypothetical protein